MDLISPSVPPPQTELIVSEASHSACSGTDNGEISLLKYETTGRLHTQYELYYRMLLEMYAK